MAENSVVFLLDVDNTLLDNDQVIADLRQHLTEAFGVQRQEHYWAIFDKLRILTAVKKAWGNRLTTVFPRQGHYATDPKALSAYPPADIAIDKIGDLLAFDLTALLGPKH